MNYLMTRAEFAAVVYVLCLVHHASVTSWIRTPRRNTAKGGVFNSHHLDGLAVDLVFDTPNDRAACIISAKSLHLDVVPEDDHVHIEVQQ